MATSMRKVKGEMKRKKSEKGAERGYVSRDGRKDSVAETSGGESNEEEEEERDNEWREKEEEKRIRSFEIRKVDMKEGSSNGWSKSTDESQAGKKTRRE